MRRFLSALALALVLFSCSGSTSGRIHADGNGLVDGKGHPVILRGLCFSDPGKLLQDGHWDAAYFAEAAAWGANVVRFAVHPAILHAAGWDEYFILLDKGIEMAQENGLYVIIDWHSIGNLREEKFTDPMYNTTREETLRFWETAALRYKGNPTVALFELFNEPTVTAEGLGECSWEQWKALNEEIIDHIRAIDPEVLCAVAGFNWAYDLTPVATAPIDRENIAYIAHPYPQKREDGALSWEAQWEKDYGFVADTFPVICTEVGFCLPDERGAHIPVMSTPEYASRITAYMEKKGISFTAWCFDPDWAPMLIDDWDFTPTTEGRAFKAYLQKVSGK